MHLQIGNVFNPLRNQTIVVTACFTLVISITFDAYIYVGRLQWTDCVVYHTNSYISHLCGEEYKWLTNQPYTRNEKLGFVRVQYLKRGGDHGN